MFRRRVEHLRHRFIARVQPLRDLLQEEEERRQLLNQEPLDHDKPYCVEGRVRMVRKHRNPVEASLERRISRAYHDYGRFCSAHPSSCLAISCMLMVFLSYPALARFSFPSSVPIDLHRTSLAEPFDKTNSPEWFFRPPTMYVQQIVVHSNVRPWTPYNLSAENVVRGALSLAFPLRDTLLEHLNESCLTLRQHSSLAPAAAAARNASLLPSSGCILLSPSAFWSHDLAKLATDEDLIRTIFTPPCTPSMCVRDILLGMPTARAGVKQYYQTNRERSITFGITVLLSAYDPTALSNLRSSLNAPDSNFSMFTIQENKTPYVHVFFKPTKRLTDFTPLLISYVIFMIYVFFSASKFEMVSSRWGLALAAGGSVSFTLLMTSGVVMHLDLAPSLWGDEIFPYLALIIGLENCLCITKAVVYTPPSMDVPARISLGLSAEGYSLVKYFVIEQFFLAVAFFIFPLAEIRDFVKFASIGLIVDFYMQMFFFAPCLAFDLQALSEAEKTRFAYQLLASDIPRLRHFPPISCPMKRLLPRLFSPKIQIRRVHSENSLVQTTSEGGSRPSTPNMERASRAERERSHRRTASMHASPANNDDDEDEMLPRIELPARLRPIQPAAEAVRSKLLSIMSFVARTRIIQRSIIIVFVCWATWVQWESSGYIEVARQLENSREDYRKHTFKWWPAVMGAYNVSLSGSYTTFLPPIVLTKSISPSDPSLSFLPTIDESSTEKVDISYRVSWLEKQIVLYLALCSITVFVMVGGFLLYIFFWDEWQKKKEERKARAHSKDALGDAGGLHSDAAFRSLANLRSPIAACTIVNPTLIASATVDGRLILWPTASSRQPDSINRLRPEDAHSHQPPHLRPRRSARHIWALSSRHSCLLVGCADGCMEIASCEEMRLLATLHTSKSSITNIVNRGPLLVIARVDGTVEFASLELTAETPSTLHALTSLRLIRCCREPLAFLLSAPLCFIAVGVDSMIKAYDSRTTECLFSLLAHNAPLSSIKIDHVENMAFSVCESAVLCAWNLTGVLAWSTDCVTNVELAITSSFLVTFSPDGRIVLREKKLGKKQSELSNQRQTKVASKMTIRVITGDLVVVSLDETIVFWDLQKQAILGEIDMEFTVDDLHIINESTILVQSTQTLVIVEVPSVTRYRRELSSTRD